MLARERAVLVVVDVQDRYRAALHGWDRVVAATTLLLQGARVLEIPVVATEQYPKGLGHTAPEIARHLPPGLVMFEKMTMSCCGAAPFTEHLAASGRSQVLVAGIETHACINQTVHDLIAAGYQVHVARDATSSRRPADVGPAWDKMRAAGMLPTTSEQALLELVRTAEAVEFKALQRLLKEAPLPADG
jgi:nicotinamidase-related amidase